ncbi:MAG: diaminopimelate epimerase [Bacteroidales bacterium]|nr:diaminopimelate epimerase [Bacteroidales bacterium]
MLVHFFKYHGTGNDFIIIDNRHLQFDYSKNSLINHLCNRRFGIGADGLMVLMKHPELDFEMKYFNSDGKEGSMCGNGGRCIAAFAKKLGIINDVSEFQSIDGVHQAIVLRDAVKLKMQNVSGIKQGNHYYFLDTGSPHYVTFRENLEETDVFEEGRNIRFNTRFKKEGINVNFVKVLDDEIQVRTYERGVENETLSCGTGVVASAICATLESKTDKSSIIILTRGGKLKVCFDKINNNSFENIWLQGPIRHVFEGKIEI